MPLDHLSVLSDSVEDIINGKKDDLTYIELTLYFVLQEVLYLSSEKVLSVNLANDLHSRLFQYKRRVISSKKHDPNPNYLKKLSRMQIKDRISVYLLQSKGISVPGYRKPIRLTNGEQKQLQQLSSDAEQWRIYLNEYSKNNYYLDQTTTSVRQGTETWKLASNLFMKVG